VKERVVALIIVIFALVFVAASVALDVGSLTEPGPGFMPAAVGAALLAVAVYNLAARFREPAAACGGDVLPLAAAGVAAATLVYPLLLRGLNYLTATFLVLAALLLFLRFKSAPVAVATALAVTLASFVFFAKLLGVVLPTGFLEETILRL
jgi:hypothetical protein